MFDAVGKNYDITNTVLGRRTWMPDGVAAPANSLQLKPTDKVLDLAAGTAVSTVELANPGPGASPAISPKACSPPPSAATAARTKSSR